jgi:transcriptional regulator with XRE-family HTH domain
MDLSEAVKEYRKEHRYSLREFADLCGLSHVQIYRIEHGANTDGKPFEPKIKTLKKLAAGMGISLDEILHYCEDLVIHWDADDVEVKVSPERQAVIDKIILATPEQFTLIQSYVNFVVKI